MECVCMNKALPLPQNIFLFVCCCWIDNETLIIKKSFIFDINLQVSICMNMLRSKVLEKGWMKEVRIMNVNVTWWLNSLVHLKFSFFLKMKWIWQWIIHRKCAHMTWSHCSFLKRNLNMNFWKIEEFFLQLYRLDE